MCLQRHLPHPVRRGTLTIPFSVRRAVTQDPQHPVDSSPTSSRTLLLRVLLIGAVILAGIGVIWYRTR